MSFSRFVQCSQLVERSLWKMEICSSYEFVLFKFALLLWIFWINGDAQELYKVVEQRRNKWERTLYFIYIQWWFAFSVQYFHLLIFWSSRPSRGTLDATSVWPALSSTAISRITWDASKCQHWPCSLRNVSTISSSRNAEIRHGENAGEYEDSAVKLQGTV